MNKLFLATKNKGKIREIKEILKGHTDIEIHTFLDSRDIPDVIEDGDTFEANSIKKAVEIAKYLNMNVIADDSGICVEALNGAPGVYSARYAGEPCNDDRNNEKMLYEMKNKENRKAKYVAVITFATPTGKYFTFEGEVEGEILSEMRGTKGFGYDPMFYIKEYDKTFGEISEEIKNKISHRGKALEKLKSEIDRLLKE